MLPESITDTYEYDAFGNEISHTGTTPNNYLYRGEQWDPDLSLYYLRARYYNPATGRFLSVDSEAGEGQRRYEYAGADPVNGMDPSGDEAIIEWALLRFYPGRLGFINVEYPGWCGTPIIGSYLPGCSGSGGGGGGGRGGGGGQNPGGPPPPPPTHFKFGIGIEVPSRLSTAGGRLNLLIDTGHTFAYLRDQSGNITSDSELSFGPVVGGINQGNMNQFLANELPGNAHWRLLSPISTWESDISKNQYQAGIGDISAFKADVPNYTVSFNCTTAALQIGTGIGLRLPNGVGPAYAYIPTVVNWSGNVPNPWTLNQEMTASYGTPQIRSANDFPKP